MHKKELIFTTWTFTKETPNAIEKEGKEAIAWYPSSLKEIGFGRLPQCLLTQKENK